MRVKENKYIGFTHTHTHTHTHTPTNFSWFLCITMLQMSMSRWLTPRLFCWRILMSELLIRCGDWKQLGMHSAHYSTLQLPYSPFLFFICCLPPHIHCLSFCFDNNTLLPHAVFSLIRLIDILAIVECFSALNKVPCHHHLHTQSKPMWWEFTPLSSRCNFLIKFYLWYFPLLFCLLVLTFLEYISDIWFLCIQRL